MRLSLLPPPISRTKPGQEGARSSGDTNIQELQGHLNGHRWMAGEKTKASTSVMSSRREGMSGRTAKVKTWADAGTTKPRRKVSRDLCTRILMQLNRKVVCFRQVPTFNTRVTANVFCKEDTERYPGSAIVLAFGRPVQ